MGKELLKLTNENYFSHEANMDYMSVSQWKQFDDCEVMAMAILNGEYVEKPSSAMLVGSYVDAYFSGEMEIFKTQNPQIFKKDGTLLKDFERANDIIKVIESDPLLMKYLGGKKQVIFTGIINGVPFKIKIDSLLPYAIVDQKIMASIRELIWQYDVSLKRNVQKDFVAAYGYDKQGGVYQEIVRQNIGERLPFILAPTTKEECPDKALIQIDQEYLDKALEEVSLKAPRFQAIKMGLIEPIGCGHCPACRMKKQLVEVISYKALFGKEDNNGED